MSNESLCWDEVNGTIAVWPSPVGCDAGFRAAGFTEFADSDNGWTGQFDLLLDRVIAFGAAHGPPVIKAWVGPHGANCASPKEALLAAARDERCHTTVVSFSATVEMVTADGHPIIWICGHDQAHAVKQALAAFASGKPVRRVPLDWTHLIPERVRASA